MKHLAFYLRHSLTHMNYNRQRTLFVLFCIAVGVAAVVSLRTLGLMIGDALTGNLQAENRGDLVITAPNPFQTLTSTGEQEVDASLIEGGGLFEATTFSERGIERIQQWADENGHQTLLAARNQVPGQLRPANDDLAAQETISVFAVQPEGYPFYREIEFVEPAGMTLAEALADENNIVITQRLANNMDLDVGDRVLIAGPEEFTVTGIVPDSSEAQLLDPNTYLFPYAYLSYESGRTLFATRADTIYVRLAEDSEVTAAAADFEESFPGLSLNTTEDLREVNSSVSEGVTRFITTMGLVSLLIGGIGIANTMIVVVSRRALEIAVLKTIGLQGRQITFMFLLEAFILGILGSILGCLLGLGLVVILQRVAEQVFSQSLTFRIYPEALLLGLVTGILVTMVFGFLPTIAAGRVRPSAVLHPTETIVPRAGRVQSLLIVLLMTGVMGILVGIVLGNFLIGMLAAYVTLGILAVALFLFWLLAVFFSRLPSFGNVYLKLAQRALGANAGRTASTLLALVVGMFSLSLILLMTRSLINVVNDVMESQIGGNVIVGTESVEAGAEAEALIQSLPELNDYQTSVIYTGSVVAINGDRDMDALIAEAQRAGREEFFGDPDVDLSSRGGLFANIDPVPVLVNLFVGGLTAQRASEYTDEYEIASGQALPADPAEPVMVLQESPATRWFGLGPGDTITVEFADGAESVIEIVGLIPEPPPDEVQVNFGSGSSINMIMSDNSLPAGIDPLPPTFIVDVPADQVQPTITQLTAVDGVFAFDISQLSEILDRLFNQLAALPLIVAVLALFASSVIIANTVSLATLERRREIGIMKSLGLDAGNVLRLLLLENGLVGLLGGIIGTGIGATFILLSGLLTDSLLSFPLLTLGLLILLAVVLALAATMLTAYGASREKPLIVLRYE